MKKTVYVHGMDCISCETVLRDALDEVPTIKVLSLKHKTGKLEMEYESEKDLKTLETILKANNYSLQDTPQNGNTATTASSLPLTEQIAIGLAVATIIRALMQINFTQYLGDYGPNMSFGIAFLVGMVACGSSCLAVTGGIVVSYMESLENKTRASMAKVQALFHIGRLIAFVGLGALLGYLGQIFQISQSVNGIVMILVGLILAYVGLQIVGVVPSITTLGFHLPTGVNTWIKKLQDPKYALLVGFLTFFLPCGFTQSMQLFAMQSGSAMQGAMILGAYALGTIPLLLGLGMSAGYFKAKLGSLNKIIAGLLIVFGLITFANGYNMMSGNKPMIGSLGVAQVKAESLTRPHDGSMLSPQKLPLEKGKSYNITINPSANGLGCHSSIGLPDGTSKPVLKNTPITFAFTPTEAGSFKLACPMGSAHGYIEVK